MKRINQNTVARNIALKEGGHKNLQISDVKEVMKLHLIELAKFEDEQVIKLLKKYK